jgi:hypothetical protein
MFDEENVLNLKTRIRNLSHLTPFGSFKSALESFIDLMKQETLQTGYAETEDERQARRVALNERKQQLLDLMLDPEALWRKYLEEKEANDGQN